MERSPLRLFVDPSWRQPELEHSPFLYPFWGMPLLTKQPLFRDSFQAHSLDTHVYMITDNVHQADMVCMPYRHTTVLKSIPHLLRTCAEVALHAKLPLLIDGMGDIEYPVTVPHAFVLRYGGYRFSRMQNEIIVPLFTNDLLEVYRKGELLMREKPAKPKIGFAGWATTSPKQKFRSIVKDIPYRFLSLIDSRYGAQSKGIFFRSKALELLRASSQVDTNFLARDSYSANTDTAIDDPHVLQKQMVDTLLDSDYGLDVRGDANASMRLFEILSLGRIPVIVDTERNFPFNKWISYKDFSLLIDFRDLRRLPQILVEFHARLSPEKFQEMQVRAREAYVRYFRNDAIMRHIIEELRARGVGSKG